MGYLGHFFQSYTLVTQPSNDTPTYIFKKNNNLGSHKNLYTNVSSNSIPNHQKWTTTQCPSTGGWINTVGYLYNGLPLSNKILLHVTPRVTLRHIMVCERCHSPKFAYGMISFIRHAPEEEYQRSPGVRDGGGCEHKGEPKEVWGMMEKMFCFLIECSSVCTNLYVLFYFLNESIHFITHRNLLQGKVNFTIG